MDPQPNKTINSSASASIPELSTTLSMTQGPAEGVPIPDLESPALVTVPDVRAPNPPSPVTLNPALPSPAQLSPAPSPSLAPRPNSITFGPRIDEALPYAMTAQTHYPLPVSPLMDYLADTAKATSREIFIAISLL